MNLFLVALIRSRNPLRSIHLLKKIRSKRQTLQGLPPVLKFVRQGRKFFLTENLPGFPSKAFNNFIKAETGRIIDPGSTPGLITVIFAITTRCRLKCSHCYEWNNLSATECLAYEDLVKIADKILAYGVYHIQFSGGEPLERFDDLTNLIRYTRKRAELWILTSGFGLTEEKALFLKKCGLTGADISLDSWDEDEHNKSRNNTDSFRQALLAAQNCRKAGLVTSFSLCAFREFINRDNLMKYAALAKSSGAGFIRLLEPRQSGRYTGMDISLHNEHVRVLENFYIEMNTSPEYSDFPIVSYPGYAQRRTGCSGAGNRYLYIDSTGNIHACPFCQESAGNAAETDFAQSVTILRRKGCHEFELNKIE